MSSSTVVFKENIALPALVFHFRKVPLVFSSGCVTSLLPTTSQRSWPLSVITPAVPLWLNKGDNAWQLTVATFVGLQSMSGLVLLYASIVKKKWAVNSAFMALYDFVAVLICWVLVGYRMAFGDQLLLFWAKGAPSLGQKFLINRAKVPESTHFHDGGLIETPTVEPFYPMASLVYFQFTFIAITLILLTRSVLGRMNIKAWMAFVPLWLLFSYTVGAFSLWGGGFLYHWGLTDYSSGHVIHLSSGIAGFTAAYWVGPRLKSDRERFPPNNVLLMLCGARMLWMGWSGFNGGALYAANIVAPIAVLNTNICASTSLLVWTSLDVVFFGKPSVIGAVQGIMTRLVCITLGAGLVQSWATILMGILSGSIPWVSMMVLHKRSTLLQKVDDTLGVFHTHAVAGLLGGLLTGLLAEPALCRLILPAGNSRGAFYGGNGGMQFLKQLVAAMFVIAWNIVSTTFILLAIRVFIPLRMPEEQLNIGDDAVHGEEAYALWGDGSNPVSPANSPHCVQFLKKITLFMRATLGGEIELNTSSAITNAP
ncbi:ammonium transporter 2-like [Pyrus communis]|uniref:ammonium transporter 2-like n=1 Tax=Pyrus communis TaxID=23211 RepID=UPI0035BFDB9A